MFDLGAEVILHGLNIKKYNGLVAEVVSEINEKGRQGVRIKTGKFAGKGISILIQNLKILETQKKNDVVLSDYMDEDLIQRFENAYGKIPEWAAVAGVNTPNDRGWCLLHQASYDGHADLIRALISANADIEAPNRTQQTPLHLACARGKDTAVEALLDAGADFRARSGRGMTPVDYARRSGYEKIVQIFSTRESGI